MKSIGQRIKEFRKINDMTQEAFCEYLGVSQGNLSHIEKYGSKISIVFLNNFMTYFNVNANWLFFGEGEVYRSNEKKTERDNIFDYYKNCPFHPNIEKLISSLERMTNLQEEQITLLKEKVSCYEKVSPPGRLDMEPSESKE